MQLADVWEKIANNARLTPEELAFLKRSATETQLRNSFVAGNTTPENTLALNLPINVIYSQVLHANTASLTIEIPPNYNHLMVFCAVRTDNADYYDFIHGQFNGDTGNNYAEVSSAFENPTGLYGSEQATRDDFGVSVCTGTSATAGASGTAFMFIPHYNGDLWKSVLKMQGSFQASAATMFYMSSFAQWKSTSKITSFKIYPEFGTNILAGSIITILGIK